MNWYKKIKIATARTLYHGTSINNYDSIKNIGLVPDVGQFVSDAYKSEYDAAGVDFDPTPLIYATDKEGLGKATGAMINAVSNFLGKGFHEVNLNELKQYGMLVIMKKGEDYFEKRPIEEGPSGDWQGETDNRYPAVEPGDYFSEDNQGPVEILIGNKMVEFLYKNGEWPPSYLESGDEFRKLLLTLAIRYHIKESPDKKEEIIQSIKDKVDNLSDEEVQKQYRHYKKLVNELV